MSDQPVEINEGNEEEKILRTVTPAEIDWITSVLTGIKQKGAGWGEVMITLKKGRIVKIRDAGEQIPDPDIYRETR